MFPSKRVRKRTRHDTQDGSIPPILEPSAKGRQPSGESHSSIQQPSMNTRNVLQRIDTGLVYPGSSQGQMHPQALNPSAMLSGQEDRVDMRSLYSPCTLPAAATNSQLTGSPRVIQYPSGMTRQQVIGNTSRAVAPVVEATHTGAVHNTTGHLVSLQSSPISNPNSVSLYGHSTNPVVDLVQSVEGYEHKFSNVSQLPPKSLMPLPSHPQSFAILPPPPPEYITGGMLDKEQHNQSKPNIMYACNACHMHIETRYHCSECEEFDLCVTCYHEKGHEHKMEKLGLEQSLEYDNQTEPQLAQNSREARKKSFQKCIQSLVHSCQCRDMSCKLQSCIKMKKFVALCLFHARSCNENQCSVPLCSNIKQKLKKQRIEHQDRLIAQRKVEMRVHSSAVTPSAKIFSATSAPVSMASLSTNTSAINQLGLPPPPDAPYHGDKPKMCDLIKIVIPMIKAKWTRVAYSMQYDAEDIEGIEKDSSDTAKSCGRLFKNWLTSPKGITPKTWRTLLMCIKDVDELAVTAENIYTELSAKYNN